MSGSDEDAGAVQDFAAALRAALADGRWTLGALAAELTAAGHPVTGATLSYWQQGRRRPGRKSSTAIVRALEEILELESGTLLAHLSAPRARGKGSRIRPIAEGSDAYSARIVELATQLGGSSGPGHSAVLVHETITLDAAGARSSEHYQQIVRSEEEGLRSLILGQIDIGGADGPGIISGAGVGVVGDALIDRDMRLLLARIDLPQPMRLGDTLFLDVTTRYPHARGRSRGHERWFSRTLREHVIDVEFHPDRLPASVASFVSDGVFVADLGHRHHEVPLAGTLAQCVHLDVPPGTSGMRWRFEDEDPDLLASAEEEPIPEIVDIWRDVDLDTLFDD